MMASLRVVPVPAQDVLKLQVKENGEFELPTGSELESVFLMESIVDGASQGYYGGIGDGGPARDALLNTPWHLAADTSGNVYVADSSNARIRKIDASGVITTIAGTGLHRYGGDGGPATSALLSGPRGVAVDASGNVYVADTYNARIRKIDASGVITTIAGVGVKGIGGDGGPATEALLNEPSGVAVDVSGNVYVADTYNARIRKIDASGVITTIAGTGKEDDGGDGGAATEAPIGVVHGVAVDAQGNVYVASHARIRKIDGQGTITSLLEEGGRDVAVDAQGNVYVAVGTAVRRIDGQGTISTFAGGRRFGHNYVHLWEGGLASESQLSEPVGLAVDTEGNVYVTDFRYHAIRVVRPAVRITVRLGDSGETAALEVSPSGVLNWRGAPLVNGSLITDSSGNTYALTKDVGGGIIATYKPPLAIPVLPNGEFELPPGSDTESVLIIESFAGNGLPGYSGDGGPAAEAHLIPSDVAVDAAGSVYVVDAGNRRVRKIDAAGIITTYAGTGKIGYSGDGGPATEAQLWSPIRVAVDAAGNLYCVDRQRSNNRIRKIDAAGIITTYAGTGGYGYSGDGGPAAEAQLDFPDDMAVDAAGNLYVSEYSRIRKIDAAGIITTFAGTAELGYSGDGGPATEAQLEFPSEVAVDAAGNVYVADQRRRRIRKIDAAGIITTFAGTGERGSSGGDGDIATMAQFFRIYGLAVDADGNVYISEGGNAQNRFTRIRKIDTEGVITTVAGTGKPDYSGDGGPALQAELRSPEGLAADAEGNVYVADGGNSRVRVLRPGTQIAVPLGSSGDSAKLLVSKAGVLRRQGASVVEGTRVTAGNGNVYSLAQRANGAVYATDIRLSVTPSAVSESNGPTEVTVTATLVGNPRDEDIVVSVSVTGNVALEGVDYQAIPTFDLTIPAGSKSGSTVVSFQPMDDELEEGSEALVFLATATVQGEQREMETTLTLVDDDKSAAPVALTLNQTSVSESDTLTAVTVMATLEGKLRPDGTPVTVAVKGSGANMAVDFTPVPSFVITIPAGEVRGIGTFDLRPENDTVDEKHERLTVSGITTSPALQVIGTGLTLRDDDPGDHDNEEYWIRTAAGSTEVADGILATNASLNWPSDVAFGLLGQHLRGRPGERPHSQDRPFGDHNHGGWNGRLGIWRRWRSGDLGRFERSLGRDGGSKR